MSYLFALFIVIIQGTYLHVVDNIVKDRCAEIDIEAHDHLSTMKEQKKNCNIWSVMGRDVANETCLCEKMGCPNWCPCSNVKTQTNNSTIKSGECSKKEYPIADGIKIIKTPTGELTFSIYMKYTKRKIIETKTNSTVKIGCAVGTKCPCYGNCCCIAGLHICGNDQCWAPAKQCSGCTCGFCPTSGICPSSGGCTS